MRLKPLNLKALWNLTKRAFEGMAWGLMFALSTMLAIYVTRYIGDPDLAYLVGWGHIVSVLFFCVKLLACIGAAFDKNTDDNYDVEMGSFAAMVISVTFVFKDQLGAGRNPAPDMGAFIMVYFALLLMMMGWGFFLLYGFLLFRIKPMPRFKLEQSHLDELVANDSVFSKLKIGDEARVRGVVPGTEGGAKVILSFERLGGRGFLGEICLELLPPKTQGDVFKFIKRPKQPKLSEQPQAA